MKKIRTLAATALVTLVLAAGPSAAQIEFTYTAEQQGVMARQNEFVSLHSFVTNTSEFLQDYTVYITREVPSLDWGANVCQGELCYPPFTEDFDILGLGPDESAELLCDFTPVGVEGQATISLRVVSQGNPSDEAELTFRCISTGVDMVFVADDDGAGLYPYYETAAGDLGLSCGTWDCALLGGSPELTEIAPAWRLFWFTGATGWLDASERAFMESYLTANRRAALSGASIGSQTGDTDWLRDYFGAAYVDEYPAAVAVNGVPGNPVGDGLFLTIIGGDGAGTNDSPEELAPAGDGVAAFSYAFGAEAGTTLDASDFRTVFLGFGLEGVGIDTERASLLAAIHNWFGADVTPADDRVPGAFVSAPLATPNPFNPRTNIAFEVGGTARAQLAVDVYDLMGRKVRTLFQGEVAPGPQSIAWDGRSDAGRTQAAGVYLARVRVNAENRQVKMTLAK